MNARFVLHDTFSLQSATYAYEQPTKQTATAITERRVVHDRHGVMLELLQSGSLHSFCLRSLVVALASSLTLLAIAKAGTPPVVVGRERW